MKKLKKLVQEKLIEAGISQAELARRIDVDPQYVNKWLAGRCNIRNHELRMVCDELNCDEIAMVSLENSCSFIVDDEHKAHSILAKLKFLIEDITNIDGLEQKLLKVIDKHGY